MTPPILGWTLRTNHVNSKSLLEEDPLDLLLNKELVDISNDCHDLRNFVVGHKYAVENDHDTSYFRLEMISSHLTLFDPSFFALRRNSLKAA